MTLEPRHQEQLEILLTIQSGTLFYTTSAKKKNLLTGEGVHEERRALAELEVLLGGRRLHDRPVGLQDEEVVGLEALLLHGGGRHVDAVPGRREID